MIALRPTAAIRTGLRPDDLPAPRLWRTGEEAAIRTLYPAGGTAACTAVLPGRARQSIRQRAHQLGVRKSGD